jgi:HD-GYP domain-containing protein (c-di-GMP phosphodiesterase class II)
MNLIPINVDSIRIGQPLPFHLVDKDGVLLARKSFVVRSRDDLLQFEARGGGLFIDGVDAEALHRAYVDQLQTMVRGDTVLGEIAESKLTTDFMPRSELEEPEELNWLDLQAQLNYLLRDPQRSNFADRLERIHKRLGTEIENRPDSALFALFQLSMNERHMYSATHALLVCVVCALAAREVLDWPAAAQALLSKAALTMNIGMTALQDQLAVQVTPPTPEQRSIIAGHAQRSVDMLQSLGVSDTTWLGAVREHHSQTPGALRDKTAAQRLARLIQRADTFGARIAGRSTRPPMSSMAAMQACYFDENKHVDEAGAALVKTVGIYQPGTYVRLATEEIAVVVRRGFNTNTPRVAVLVNRSGMPTVEPVMRDTSLREFKVVSGVPHREVKVQVNLERMLPLTRTPASDRLW